MCPMRKGCEKENDDDFQFSVQFVVQSHHWYSTASRSENGHRFCRICDLVVWVPLQRFVQPTKDVGVAPLR